MSTVNNLSIMPPKLSISNLQIRSAQINDANALYDFYKSRSESTIIMFDPFKTLSPERINNLILESNNGKHIIAIAINNNKILGTAFIMNLDRKISEPTFGIGLDEIIRGLGIGYKLSKFVLDKFGGSKLILKVIKENTVAFNLYNKLGFKIYNIDDQYYYMEINK